MWYVVPSVNLTGWLADVVDLFSSTLESIQAIPVLYFFAIFLMFFVILAFFFWMSERKHKR